MDTYSINLTADQLTVILRVLTTTSLPWEVSNGPICTLLSQKQEQDAAGQRLRDAAARRAQRVPAPPSAPSDAPAMQ